MDVWGRTAGSRGPGSAPLNVAKGKLLSQHHKYFQGKNLVNCDLDKGGFLFLT